MRKSFNLREVTKSDWRVLLEWRNDKITRQNSFNSDLVSVSEHKEYIKNAITSSIRALLILEYNEIPVGTIREDRLDKDEFELSYTISPMYRGKKIGQIMMSLYLVERKGSFSCKVSKENIPSIKMIEKFGFKLFKKEKKANIYKLNRDQQSGQDSESIKNTENKILFLGKEDSPILDWLFNIGESVIQTSEKITPEFLNLHKINFIISHGYLHIIKKDILDLYPDRAINLHISYLPFNRGYDPNFWSFIENTPKGVTIHYLDEGVDTGDIIIQEKVEFDNINETLATSYAKLQSVIQNLFENNWEDIKTKKIKSKKQIGAGTFHKQKDKTDLNYLLKDDWNTLVSVLKKHNTK
jgi:methionyl-tRNA formyltransferase